VIDSATIVLLFFSSPFLLPLSEYTLKQAAAAAAAAGGGGGGGARLLSFFTLLE